MKNLNVNEENLSKEESYAVNKEKSKKLTGKPSIDRPWLKYYSDKARQAQVPEKTIYDYLFEKNKNNLLIPALNYFDRKITFDELFSSIDFVAKSFIAAGVKQGDIVTLCMPTLPETIYSIYGLNKIGAVANIIDPRNSLARITEQIKNVDSKLLLYVDLCAPKIKAVIDDTNIKQAVSVSPADSLPLALNLGYKAKELFQSKGKSTSRLPKDDRFMKWQTFIKEGKGISLSSSVVSYQKDMPAAIVHTGGTTGVPKGVVLSNENLNAMSVQYGNSGITNMPGQKFLDIMPPFIAYGLVNGIHMPLTLGMTDIIIPQFNPEEFVDLLLKYKPAHFMGVPTHYEPVLASSKMEGEDLSFLVSPGAGGDAVNPTLEEKINSFLDAHYCETKLAKGYGMTELSSAVTVCISNEVNEIGGVGIPLPLTNVTVVDPITKEELGYNQEGEIWATGPTKMLGYYNNSEETEEITAVSKDGTEWIKTGDLGTMNENGMVTIASRMKEIIIRPDGHNVSPKELTNLVVKHKAVKDCAVVGIPAEGHTQGKYPKACVVLKEQYKGNEIEVKEELDMLCQSFLPERDVPLYYEFLENLPVTPIGKIDKIKLASTGTECAMKSSVSVTKLSNVKIKR